MARRKAGFHREQQYARGPTMTAVAATGTISSTIDLHGFRKSEGIKTLTGFLEKEVSKFRKQGKFGDIWVLVVTGTGAHSPEGPVLRTAVANLLQKRQMEFITNTGKGSFTVKANSGITFYEPGVPVDTKLLIREAPDRTPPLPGPGKFVMTKSSLLADEDEAPTPNEVAATDKAIEESRKYHEKTMQEAKKEEHIMKRAVSMSILDAKKEEEEENEMVQRAMSMSLLEKESYQDDFDEDLRKALEISQNGMQTSCHGSEDIADLEATLELSRAIITREDEELLKVMELSKKEYETGLRWKEDGFGRYAQTWL